jgi:RNA polymerase sigma-70 factor (ECF subfamily)
MIESPDTRASLLVRIRDGQDTEAWQQFITLYAPVVYGFARRRGLQDADAADLMQEVLRSVAASVGRLDYDPKRGTFRSWLFTVTRSKLYNLLNGQRRQVRGTGDSAAHERLDEQAGRDGDGEATWEREYQTRLAAIAMDRVRGEFQEATWKAFELTALEGKPARDAGGTLGMSPGAVYVAKSRVLARLREEIQKLQEE